MGGIILVGPRGELKLEKGVIIPQRHIHCSSENAKIKGLAHGDIVSVRVIRDIQDFDAGGEHEPVRQITFGNVIVRAHKMFDWQMHLDIDEGNAAGIKMKGVGEVLLSKI